MKLFVYGTLKQGYSNHDVLHGARFIGQEQFKLPFVMIDLGYFPGLLPSEDDHIIYGEVYEINKEILDKTDILEGYPYFYDRININDTWIYVLPLSDIDKYQHKHKIYDGVWL